MWISGATSQTHSYTRGERLLQQHPQLCVLLLQTLSLRDEHSDLCQDFTVNTEEEKCFYWVQKDVCIVCVVCYSQVILHGDLCIIPQFNFVLRDYVAHALPVFFILWRISDFYWLKTGVLESWALPKKEAATNQHQRDITLTIISHHFKTIPLLLSGLNQGWLFQ